MRLPRLGALLGDTLVNLRRGGWGGLAAVGAIAVCSLILGCLWLLTVNLQAILSDWRAQFEVVVFLRDDITAEQQERLRRWLHAEAGVAAVQYTSKEEALALFKREIRGQASLLEGLGENPLPASFQLRIREGHQTGTALRAFATALERLDGVEEVLYGRDWVDQVARLVSVLQVAGWAVGTILGGAAVFIVANTIRLAVYGRAEEIEILRIVGATRGYIRAPFILEGLLQGLLGAGLALLLLFVGYRFVVWRLAFTPSGLLGLGGGRFLEPLHVAGLLLTGAMLGGAGSLLSVRRFLKA
jgi:cell division transport system permease protein